jgi:hypothetical protein
MTSEREQKYSRRWLYGKERVKARENEVMG